MATMRIILKHQISGTRNGEDWPAAGSTVDLPDDEAAGLLATNSAVLPDDEASIESAAVNTKPTIRTAKEG